MLTEVNVMLLAKNEIVFNLEVWNLSHTGSNQLNESGKEHNWHVIMPHRRNIIKTLKSRFAGQESISNIWVMCAE